MRFYGAEAMQLQGLKNRRCIEHMQKALPGFAMRPKAAIVGVTYSGTAYLWQVFDASPHIVAFPVISKADVFKVALPDLERRVLTNRPAVLLSATHRERIRRVVLASSGPREYLARFVPLGPIGSFCETVPLEA